MAGETDDRSTRGNLLEAPAQPTTRHIAVAIRAAETNGFAFCAVDVEDLELTWSGTIKAPTIETALLDVFVMIRSGLGLQDRIRFLVRLGHTSPIWSHHGELRAALPRCTVEWPGSHDSAAMAAANAGLPFKAESSTPSAPSSEEQPDLDLPPLIVAADGSVRGKFSGNGWLASDGQYGLRGRMDLKTLIGKRPSMVAELRAIDDAVRKLPHRDLTIVCDNSYAVSMARKWMNGSEILPEGYLAERGVGKTAGLVAAQRRIHANRDRLDIRWERSHQGEPLNEGADALARLASRFARGNSGLSPDDYRDRAKGLADVFAADFRQRQSQPPLVGARR